MTVWTTSFLFLTKLNICCVWTTILRKLHPDSVHVLMSTSDIREGWASVTADTSELVSDIKSHTKITCIIHNFCSKLVMYFAYWFVCFHSNFSLGWDSIVNIGSNNSFQVIFGPIPTACAALNAVKYVRHRPVVVHQTLSEDAPQHRWSL